MAASNIIKHSHDPGSIVLNDGTGTPLTLTVRFDNGDFSVGTLQSGLRAIVAYKQRGKTVALRLGDPEYPQLSFSCFVSDLSEPLGGTIQDWIAKRAPFAARVSTSTAIGDADTSDVIVTFEGTAFGDGSDQTYTCEDVALSYDFASGEPNKISITGVVYGDIKINNSTAFVASR